MPVSGRYETPAPTRAGVHVLHLRIDVDAIVDHAPVLDRISADVFISEGGDGASGRLECSWFADVSAAVPRTVPFLFSGPVVLLRDSRTAEVCIRIDRPASAPGLRATVTLTVSGERPPRTFVCDRMGDAFRVVQIDMSVCDKVSFQMPAYPISDAHIKPLPSGVVPRTLTLKRALAEAGIQADLGQRNNIVDASDEDQRWDDAELDGVLSSRLRALELDRQDQWPRWFIWAFMASRHVDSETRGVMFDSDARPRRGFAVFRDHRDFALDLPAHAPQNLDEALASRFYLFTWIHEIGHCFNVKHSDDKRRFNALSWMNDDDALKNKREFWSRFAFRFDDEELLHLRHGHWREVVMGGDSLGTGGHLTSRQPVFGAPAPLRDAGPPPLEVLLRSRGYFDFMGPVRVELRLRNLRPDRPQVVNADLRPETGHVRLLIRRPDGRTVEYLPLVRAVRPIRQRRLARAMQEGRDRYSEEIDLTYGRDGFYFDSPGEYGVCAVYRTRGGGQIASNWLRLRVGQPWSRHFDRIAQDFFGPDAGRCLYLQGSQAPYLKRNGFDVLQDMAWRSVGTMLGSDLALSLMPGVGRSFRALDGKRLRRIKGPDPQGALALTDRAVRLFESRDEKDINLRHRRLVASRADYYESIGEAERALDEMVVLHRRLKARQVHASVLGDVRKSALAMARRHKRPTPKW